MKAGFSFFYLKEGRKWKWWCDVIQLFNSWSAASVFLQLFSLLITISYKNYSDHSTAWPHYIQNVCTGCTVPTMTYIQRNNAVALAGWLTTTSQASGTLDYIFSSVWVIWIRMLIIYIVAKKIEVGGLFFIMNEKAII